MLAIFRSVCYRHVRLNNNTLSHNFAFFIKSILFACHSFMIAENLQNNHYRVIALDSQKFTQCVLVYILVFKFLFIEVPLFSPNGTRFICNTLILFYCEQKGKNVKNTRSLRRVPLVYISYSETNKERHLHFPNCLGLSTTIFYFFIKLQ